MSRRDRSRVDADRGRRSAGCLRTSKILIKPDEPVREPLWCTRRSQLAVPQTSPRPFLDDHCWLEINEETGEELVLDLTCDQARGFDRPIVFDSKTDLDQERIYYRSRVRVDVSNLRKNPVWPRYQTLLVNLRQLASNNHTSQEGPDRSSQFGAETLQLARAL